MDALTRNIWTYVVLALALVLLQYKFWFGQGNWRQVEQLRAKGGVDPTVLIIGSAEQYGRDPSHPPRLTEEAVQAPRTVYAATKAALENLVATYGEEVKNVSAIRTHIIDPGATRTAMRAKAYPGEDPATLKLPEVVANRLIALLGEQFASPHRETVNQAS